MVADGLISPKCQLFREGQSQWQVASAIFPQLAAGPASDDPAVRAMAEWLAHPMEFGEPPTSCRVIAAYDMEWPFHDEDKIALLPVISAYLGFTFYSDED